jgi:RND family efflux transporter MFP subunit
VLALAGCSRETPEIGEAPVRPAKLITLQAVSDTRSLSFPAVIEARESADLGFQIGGLVQSLGVEDGQRVERGVEIARLDQSKLRNDLTTAQSQFDSADVEFQRAKRLLAQNAVARNVYEQRKSAVDVARAALDSVRKTLDDSVIRAPFAGVIARVHAKQFQNVQPNETVVTLQTTGAAEARVQIPSRLVANSGRIDARETVVVLDAAPDVRVPAVFATATTQADPETQSFAVKFAFTPPVNLRILPGMTGRVEATMALRQPDGSTAQLKVPLGAILADGDVRYVWLVDEKTMTVSRRQVTLAANDVGETLRVEAGLQAGDVIVGAGAAHLHEGMQIRRYEP